MGNQFFDTPQDALAHYGVQGMKWGVRKAEMPDVPRKTYREAGKDASEFARAKMFYGEGAGTRRKLIKAKVEAKSKLDPMYKKAFDHHMEQQNLGKHANKAQNERRRKDTVSFVKKTTNQVNRAINGPFATPIAAAAAAAAYAVAKTKGWDEAIIRNGDQFVKNFLK